MNRLLLLFALLLLTAVSGVAQQDVSIGEYLNPDGSLNLERGFNGSLDSRGWRMTTAGDGSPRFSRPTAQDTTYRNVDGDEYWDERFGPPGSSGMVNAIAVRGEEVYIGGRFVTVGDVVAFNVACWNTRTETWSVLGTRSNNGVGGPVYSIAINGDDIYVGGTFQNAGVVEAFGIARWNRTRNVWSPLREGLLRDVAPPWRTTRGGDVYAIAVRGDSLFVGGMFGNPTKGFTAPGSDYSLMVWHTRLGRWFTIGSPNGYIRALVVRGNSLYAGGLFASVAGVFASNIARFDLATATWHPLGAGTSDTVHAMAFDSSGSLYAGGHFDSAGSVAAANIARWDGTRWYAIGAGAEGPVDAITADRQGTIYVGGKFTRAGEQLCNGVARWNGAAWAPVGSGVGVSRNATSRFTRPGSGASHPGIIYAEYEIITTRDPQIGALAALDEELYGGGMFSTAGTVTAHNVARWNTRRWRPVIKLPAEPPAINGVDGQVYAVAVSGEYLYVGGDFTRAGDIAAKGIARWNTITGTWSTLGIGIGGPAPFVRALAVRGGTIVVGGIFTTAGGAAASGIAVWDGDRWSSLDSGMGGETPYVFALVYHNNELYAAGAFSSAGVTPNEEGIDESRIARWDGRVWHPVGTGITGQGIEYSYVTSLASGTSGLFAGGEFTRAGSTPARRIARWDGTSWSALGEGLDGLVSALVSDGTTLYAGGEFLTAGSVAVSRIARWNGTLWSAVASGMNAPVRSLALLAGGVLHAGGEFTTAGGARVNHLARFDGTSWQRIGSDTASGTNGLVSSIVGGEGSLFVGGLFSVASGMGAQNIAEWDGRNWSALGSDPAGGLYGTVVSVGVYGAEVYVGGLFDAVGGMRASGIARWDGVKWTRLGKGVDGVVRAIAFDRNGDLYIGGEFRNAGEITVNGIARWDGSRWHSLGDGVDGNVYALSVDGNQLYAGGRFQRAGGIGASNIARWDLVAGGWSALGSGITGPTSTSYVAALASRSGLVYAGGRFNIAGGVAAANIARWDGSSWSQPYKGVGLGATPGVYALAFGPQGELYVGGAFHRAGDVSIRNVAEWRDTGWTALGVTGVFGNEPGAGVYSLSYGPGGLYAGGQFLIADFVQANGLARWNGTAWSSLGSGVISDYELAMVTSVVADVNGDLYAGGTFTIAGGKPSYYFSVWHPTTAATVSPRGAAPARTSLLSAMPNPLSGSTRLEIDLADAGPIRLTISAINGRAVSTLFDGYAPAGRQIVEWNAEGLDAGIYIYTLRTPAGIESGRLVVVR